MGIEAIVERAKGLLVHRQTVFIAIDGCGGAGKSTLAQALASRLGAAQIVHMDDFYKLPSQRAAQNPQDREPGGGYDIDRLLAQVLLPLRSGKPGLYYRNDWESEELKFDGPVQSAGAIIVEGCYSTVAGLRGMFDITVFVSCDRETRLRRGLRRDGEGAFSFWLEWMAEEDRYLAAQSPESAADFIVDGEAPYG